MAHVNGVGQASDNLPYICMYTHI